MAGNSCWGIEVGAYAIKGVKLERDGDEVRVADYSVIPHPRVLSEPGVEEQDVLRVSLGSFVAQNDLTRASVAVSVPGHSAFARFAKLPPVEPKKVPDIVKFEAVQQIPFPLEEVEWDYQTFQNPDSPEIEVGIFAITKERVQQQLDLLGDVGITPDTVTLSPVAAYNALAYDLQFTESTPGTIILDIGTTSTDLVVAEAGRVWVRTFPLGGHQFTEALVNAFKLSYAKAEKLKREAEGSKHARHAFQAMRPVFGDLVQDVQRSIGYYQSLHPDAKLQRLIGIGSTFKLPGLRKFLKQQLQMDVYRMDQFKRLSVDGAGAGDFQSATLNIATAYGLALQGLEFQTIEANLMPVGITRQEMWRKKVKWFGMAAALGLAAAGAMFIRPALDWSAVSRSTKPAEIDRTLRDFDLLKSAATEALGEINPDLTAAQFVTFVEDRDLIPLMLNDISGMLVDAQTQAEASTSDAVRDALAAGPIFVVKALDSSYTGPAETQDTGGGGGFGGPDPRGFNDPPPDPDADPDSMADDPGAEPEIDLEGKARVVMELDIETTHPDPHAFVLTSIDRWVNEHRQREGVPYVIDAQGRYYLVGAPDGGGGNAPPANPRFNPRTRQDPRAGRNNPGVAPPFGRSDPRQGNQPGSPPRQGQTTTNPDQLAPLDRPEQPELTKTRIRVTLPFVIVGEPEQQDAGGDP